MFHGTSYCPGKFRDTLHSPAKFEDTFHCLDENGCFSSRQSRGHHENTRKIPFIPKKCRGQSLQALVDQGRSFKNSRSRIEFGANNCANLTVMITLRYVTNFFQSDQNFNKMLK